MSLPIIYPAGSQQYTPNLGLGLFGADEVVANNFLLIDDAFGGGFGSVISVFGRQGVVVAQVSDYASFYDTLGAASTAQSNAEAFTTSAISSLVFPHTQTVVTSKWLNS